MPAIIDCGHFFCGYSIIRTLYFINNFYKLNGKFQLLISKYFIMKNYHTYKVCIDACLNCAALCNHCANSCLQEENVAMMAKCIQLDMECAAMCYAAAHN